jgi:hypothetical protein
VWQAINYKGFEINVLPVCEDGLAQRGMLYSYIGYICRIGADIRVGGRQVFFSNHKATFANPGEAWDDGCAVGRSIIDGTHSDRSVAGL